jgi:hypothetical protein
MDEYINNFNIYINSIVHNLKRRKNHDKLHKLKLIYHTERDLNDVINELSNYYGYMAIYRDDKKYKSIGLYDGTYLNHIKINFYQK